MSSTPGLPGPGQHLLRLHVGLLPPVRASAADLQARVRAMLASSSSPTWPPVSARPARTAARPGRTTSGPGLKYADGTPITTKDVKYAIERSNYAHDVLSNGPTYFASYLVDNKTPYKGPYKDKSPDGLKSIADAGRHDDRLPPEAVVRRLRLPGQRPADRSGAAGEGHRRRVREERRLLRPVHVPELQGRQGRHARPEPELVHRRPTRSASSTPTRSPSRST